jgi:hypothetical protein
MPTPPAFRGRVTATHISVLPIGLAKTPNERFRPGWCTYTDIDPSPEMEVLCGGVNSKTPDAGAIWRQGNLLHFGFDVMPDRMSASGRQLLVNAVCYIFRFSEDRPIAMTPSPFTASHRLLRRTFVDQKVTEGGIEEAAIRPFLTAEAAEAIESKSPQEVHAWYLAHRSRLRPRPGTGTFEIDDDLVRLDAHYDRLDDLLRVAQHLDSGDSATRDAALRALRRYLPSGPDGEEGSDWASWIESRTPCLFFSELGGFRWYEDPLAHGRGVPSATLTGPARASRPAPRPKTK